MILKLQRQTSKVAINRWKCIPYVVEWKWERINLSEKNIINDKTTVYDEIIYDRSYYDNFTDETEMSFARITIVIYKGTLTENRLILTALDAFMLNDDGKTIERM